MGRIGRVADRLVRVACVALLAVFPSGVCADDARIQVINVFGPNLDREDARAIADGVSNVARTEMRLSDRMKVGFGATHLEAAVFADEHPTPRASFADKATWPLDLGTFISEGDDAKGSKVAVIGSPVRDRLFGAGSEPLGEHIVIAGVGFRVIGVLGVYPPFAEGQLPPGDLDEETVAMAMATCVYVPFEAGRLIIPAATRNYALIRVWVKDQASIEATQAEVHQVLEQRTGDPVRLEIVTFPPGSLPTADESFGDAT